MKTKFNHITLNSGHINITSAKDIDEDIAFTVLGIIKDAKTEGGYLFEDDGGLKTKMKIVTLEEGNAYLVSLWCYHEKSKMWICILTTVCCLKDTQGFWWQLHQDTSVPLKTKAEKCSVKAPWIADRIEQNNIAAFNPLEIFEIMTWTGDMSRTISIMLLANKEVV